jgi:hypothetical protein
MTIMGDTVSTELFGRLWDDYVQAAKQYQLARHVVDQAEAAHHATYAACERAYTEEVKAGRAMMRASAALQAASDAAFLSEHGISPDLTGHLG